MANTTPSAILSALSTTIKALTPSGGATGRTAYEAVNNAAFKEDPDTLAESAIDRKFALMLTPESIDTYGLTTRNLHMGRLELMIGHQLTNDWDGGRDRKDKDIHQLISQLVKESNRPTGVWRIAYQAPPTVQHLHENRYWWTTVSFVVQYAIDSNYGG